MPPVGNLYLKGGNRPKRVENPDNVKGKKIQKCKEEYKENLMHIIKFFAYKEGVLKKEKQLKAI